MSEFSWKTNFSWSTRAYYSGCESEKIYARRLGDKKIYSKFTSFPSWMTFDWAERNAQVRVAAYLNLRWHASSSSKQMIKNSSSFLSKLRDSDGNVWLWGATTDRRSGSGKWKTFTFSCLTCLKDLVTRISLSSVSSSSHSIVRVSLLTMLVRFIVTSWTVELLLLLNTTGYHEVVGFSLNIYFETFHSNNINIAAMKSLISDMPCQTYQIDEKNILPSIRHRINIIIISLSGRLWTINYRFGRRKLLTSGSVG